MATTPDAVRPSTGARSERSAETVISASGGPTSPTGPLSEKPKGRVHSGELQEARHEKVVQDGGIEIVDGKRVLTELDCWEELPFVWPTWKKWFTLSIIFVIQISMNYNAAIYSNAVPKLSEHFHISLQAARCGGMIFLIAYAFGSELWAPWSEELGRWPILQGSLLFVNIWQLPCALAPNFGSLMVGRFLGGLSSAGGSVTLGMIADMWKEEDQQWAVAFIVFSSVGGSVVAPIFGGFLERYCNWHWIFWSQLIFGGITQIIHFFLCPETRTTVLLDRIAKRRRQAGEDVWGPNEVKKHRFSKREVLLTWARPFEMFAREPIVLCLSLLSGFSDALIYTFLSCFGFVYSQWGFGIITTGLSFIPILIGYIIAYISFIPTIASQRRRRKENPNLAPEARLWWLLWTAPLLPIGMLGFAWTSYGPPKTHWIAPMIFSSLVGIANYAIYFATIDYMVAAYGPYAASATGGNALARDFLAGVAALYSVPLYQNLGTHSLEWASTLMGLLAVIITLPIFVFYWYGPQIRARSKFAQTLANDRQALGRKATTEKQNVHAATGRVEGGQA